MSSLELLICAILIGISAYLSASEIALFSLSRFQLRSIKENFRPVYRKIKKLLSDPSGLLITILVVNEIVNIALSAIITEIVARHPIPVPESLSYLPYWAFQLMIGTLVTAPIILFFCEITPKVIGAKINQLIASLNSGTLIIIYHLFKPVRVVLTFLISFISKIGETSKPEKEEAILKESDFLLMVEEGHKEGSIQETELELIRNVFELDRTTVSDVATPLSQVLTLPVHTTLKGALITMRSQRYSRIPIIGTNRKEIVGILYLKDLIKFKLQPETAAVTVATLMRKPFFVSPTMRLNTLFRKFKQQKIHMAIVRNTVGEVIGVVTMSDVLDALFEDLYSEDHESKPTARTSP